LRERDAIVVGLSDQFTGLYDKSGIDVDAAIDHVSSPKNRRRTLEGFPAERITNAELLELPCDILVPAAIENQLTVENARKIKAQLIAEAANGPTTPAADGLFSQSGVTVIPDILANAGGVTVSYFEWAQDRMGYYWKEREVNDRLADVLRENFDAVWDIAENQKVTLRTAAYMLAIRRVVDSLLTRGIYA